MQTLQEAFLKSRPSYAKRLQSMNRGFPTTLVLRWIAIGGVLTLWCALPVSGQPVDGKSVANAPIAISAETVERTFPGGASLKSDAENERLLTRAREAVAEGKLDLAIALWQKLLNESEGNLVANELIEPLGPTSGPLVIYRPVRDRVEQEIGRLE